MERAMLCLSARLAASTPGLRQLGGLLSQTHGYPPSPSRSSIAAEPALLIASGSSPRRLTPSSGRIKLIALMTTSAHHAPEQSAATPGCACDSIRLVSHAASGEPTVPDRCTIILTSRGLAK